MPTPLLPPKTPIRVISGKYKNRQGRTEGQRLDDGFYNVHLPARGSDKAIDTLFTLGQLEPLWAVPPTSAKAMDLTDITVFDFETNGTNPHLNQVIEVAAIRYINLQPVSTFETLVHCPDPLPAKITELTGITTEMSQGATMTERNALAALRVLAGDSTLVAHNAVFDLSFLHFGCQRLGSKSPLTNPFLCTMTVARSRYSYPHKLGDLCARLGIQSNGAHRALKDVQSCFELMVKMHSEQPVMSLMNTIGYLPKYGRPDWSPQYASLIAQ
jgi:DNA polymerase-3 subunit epsilon